MAAVVASSKEDSGDAVVVACCSDGSADMDKTRNDEAGVVGITNAPAVMLLRRSKEMENFTMVS